MTKPKTVREARQRTGILRQSLGVLQQSLVEKIEEVSMRVMEVSESRYFGIVGYAPHVDLRKAVVLLLRRHPELRLSEERVAEYLNMPRSQVEEYEMSAASVLAAGSASAFGREMQLICAYLDQLSPAALLAPPVTG